MPATPNLLLLFPDQWRWDWLGHFPGDPAAYGKVPVRTPNLDRLAQRGVSFRNCRTNSPVCAPARACLAQGVRYEHCSVPSNGFNTPVEADNVFKRLRDAGYRVACTGKTDLQKHGLHKGLDGWTPAMGQLGFIESANQCGKWDAVHSGAEQPADPYMAHLHHTGWARMHADDYARRKRDRGRNVLSTFPTPLARAHYTDDFCGRETMRMLDRWSTDPTGEGRAPWMLWVNFPGPHEPFDPPAELMRRYDGVAFPEPVEVDDSAQPQDHQQLRRNYAAMCEGIDEWVGRLLAAVEARGELDNTLVIFCSDHGEMLGDHGRWFKSVPHEGSVHVPLIVAGPGVPGGVTRDEPVELIDLAATCLEAAGLAVPETMDARPLPTTDQPTRGVQVSALKDWRMICDGRYKLVEFDNDPPQLFDLHEDPCESRNLAGDQPQVVARLAERYRQEIDRVAVG